MLFKNLTIYQLPPNYFLLPSQFNDALAQYQSREPGAREGLTYGFVPPAPQSAALSIQTTNNAKVICTKKIEKIVPAAAVKDLLQKQIAEVEAKENRKLSKKEITRLKDEIIFSILPNALTKSATTYAYLDFDNHVIVVDSSSAKKAEDLLTLLRKALGSLPVVPLTSETHPEVLFTNWSSHHGSLPDSLTPEREFELRGFENGVIRVKDQDLITEETLAHIDTSMQVTKLKLTFNNWLTFVLTDALQVKKLKFLDLVQEQIADVDAESQTEYFVATMAIQVGAIRKLLGVLDEELVFRVLDDLPLDDEDLA